MFHARLHDSFISLELLADGVPLIVEFGQEVFLSNQLLVLQVRAQITCGPNRLVEPAGGCRSGGNCRFYLSLIIYCPAVIGPDATA